MSYKDKQLYMTICTNLQYMKLLSENKIEDNKVYCIIDSNKIMIGRNEARDTKKESSGYTSRIRITNCKCCGAILPYTDNDFVTCEYCDSIQNIFDIKRF